MRKLIRMAFDISVLLELGVLLTQQGQNYNFTVKLFQVCKPCLQVSGGHMSPIQTRIYVQIYFLYGAHSVYQSAFNETQLQQESYLHQESYRDCNCTYVYSRFFWSLQVAYIMQERQSRQESQQQESQLHQESYWHQESLSN